MSREVPKDWLETEIGEVAEIQIGGTPSRCVPSYWAQKAEDGLPWLSIADMRAPEIFRTKERITASGAKNSNVKLIKAGTVLMSFKLSIGKVAIAGVPLYTNEAIAAFTPNKTKLENSFLRYALPHFVGHVETDQAVKGVTLNKAKLKSLVLLLPPLHEQRRIAEILSSVDEAIATTRAVIEQTRKVKQGALERLLTEGIGHTRFKQTEIGEIPEGWEVATLEELLADIPNPMRSGPFGSALKSEELVDSGVPFLGIDNIQVEQFIRNYKRFLSEDKFRQLRRFAVNPNDVVITIMGTVGRCCVVPPDIGEAVSSKHIWAMSLNRERYIAELACWQMNFAPWIVSKFTTSAQGGIMSAINSGILRKLVFPVPGLEEQRQIFQVWQSFQSELEVEQAKLQNLENLKSALMSDLLTGRKRVTDALPMAAE